MVSSNPQQLSLPEVAPPVVAPAPRQRDEVGRFLKKPGSIPSSAEVATVWKGEFLGDFSLLEFPTLSIIRRYRANGEGLRLYDNMLLTDSDMEGLFTLIFDKVLHYPWVIRAASNDPEHQAHAAFLRFAVKYVPHLQNALRHFLDSYVRGFSVTEKMYEVVPRGEFAGAVVWSDLLDKPTRWFTFAPDRSLRFRTVKSYSPGEVVDQRKFIVTTYGTNSDPFGEPILDSCYWLWRLRHHALKAQAIYFDKWASPTGRAKYQSSSNQGVNEENRQKALRVLQAIQNDQAIAYPEGMELSLLESMRNGSVSFENYLDQLWGALSRRITGQTLAGSGAKGGSYALGKVHAEAIANKTEMLAAFVSSYFSRELRELIDLNFGPQDSYPRFEILARDLADKQAFLEIELLLLSNGHKTSMAYSDDYLQNVLPTDPSDDLAPNPGEQPPQQIAVPPSLAASEDPDEASRRSRWQVTLATARTMLAARAIETSAVRGRIAFAVHRDLHAKAVVKANAVRSHLDSVAATASAKAKPAITKVVKSIGSKIRQKKKANDVTKGFLLKGIKKYDSSGLGAVFDGMISSSPQAFTSFARSSDSAASDAAKIAFALQMYGIVDSIARDAADAPSDMTASDFADSLLDDNAAGDSVVTTQSAVFDSTHPTNIASMATGQLRDQLQDPDFRAQYPYVMFVVTNPNARASHQMMDGYVMSSEQAAYSGLMAPLDFGCDCVMVPISAEEAQATGLTGASPSGSLDSFLKGKGATPSRDGGYLTANGTAFSPGPASGFRTAYASTDMYAQLDALRQKADVLQQEDPEAWAQMKLWLIALFSYDPLTSDPKRDRNENAA